MLRLHGPHWVPRKQRPPRWAAPSHPAPPPFTLSPVASRSPPSAAGQSCPSRPDAQTRSQHRAQAGLTQLCGPLSRQRLPLLPGPCCPGGSWTGPHHVLGAEPPGTPHSTRHPRSPALWPRACDGVCVLGRGPPATYPGSLASRSRCRARSSAGRRCRGRPGRTTAGSSGSSTARSPETAARQACSPPAPPGSQERPPLARPAPHPPGPRPGPAGWSQWLSDPGCWPEPWARAQVSGKPGGSEEVRGLPRASGLAGAAVPSQVPDGRSSGLGEGWGVHGPCARPPRWPLDMA